MIEQRAGHGHTPPVVSSARRTIAGAPYFAEIRAVSFDGEDLMSVAAQHVRFRRCSFRGADLRGATLDGCSFSRCDLTGADLRGASLRSSTFTGCDLRRADLRDCDLTEAEITFQHTGDGSGRTDVTGARFDGANLTDVSAERVIGWPAA
jgi:uncharacterized protein YjbI with pentapeptide repeats